VPQGLKDAEATGGERQKLEQAIITRAAATPFSFDVRLNQIPEEWHLIALRFKRANGIRDGDRERSIW
jgi:hypothetical protein